MTKEPLDRLCARDDRPHLARPFAVDDYAVATDGRMMLTLAGVEAPPPHEGAPVAQARTWLAEAPSGRVVSLAALRAFAGGAVWESPCPECDGIGKLAGCPECAGTKRIVCVCLECDNEHERDCECVGTTLACEECRASGKTSELTGEAEPVRVEGATVDRRRLARLLACAPDGESVRVAAVDSDQCLALWGAGWHARLMALRSDAPARIFEWLAERHARVGGE